MIATRRFTSIGVVVALIALAVLWALFRPELLFVNARVNEAPPAAVGSAPPAAADAPPAAAPPVAWSGTFQGLAHATSGTADARVVADGSRVVRLENFSTSNGPDVRVYLVRGGDGTQDAAINNGDFIDLGALKGNIGDQNYAIPADVDLSQYQSVSLWCRRFSVNFGATTLDA